MTCLRQKQLYSSQGFNRIKLHYSSYVSEDHVFSSESLAPYICCDNLGRKLQLNGRNRDLCILLLFYFRNSRTSDGTEENYPKNHFIAENNNGCFDERDQRESTITGFN